MSFEGQPLTNREISLIEDLGAMRRLIEVEEQVILALITRLGGAAHITRAELEHDNKTYILEKHIDANDYTFDIKLAARLR